MATILIVDDDHLLNKLLSRRLETKGYTVFGVLTLSDGLRIAENNSVDIVLLDVKLPDGSGLESLHLFSATDSSPEIIIMTGAGDAEGAKMAIECGAWSYLEKPHVVRDLLLPLTRALEFRAQKKTVKTVTVALKRESIIGNSPAITKCIEQIANTASSDSNVLITGKTGTGKELFAKAVHANSQRADHPFVVVDCASLPESLVESILFGHIKGAFTGAEREHIGLIQRAHKGTLFLDEIGELPFEAQKKFLRVIQEGAYRRVGSSQESFSDFIVIAATNQDLDTMCLNNQFRSDLLFRLRSFHIHIPPLHDRIEDIALLANHIVAKLCHKMEIENKIITIDFLAHLTAYHWPGNIRELQQALEEVCAKAYHHHSLFAYHLADHIRIHHAQQALECGSMESGVPGQPTARPPLSWKEYKRISEKEYIMNIMAYTSHNIREACEISGLSRARIYQLLKKQSS